MLHTFFIFLIFVEALVSADEPYIPCQSYISFSYDDSSSLSNNDFNAQINFIKNAIGALNYPIRLRAEGGFGGEFTWNSKFSISRMQSLINSAEQTSIPYSLLQQFSSLATNYEVLGNYSSSFSALIFISDTSDSALKNADRLFPKLTGIQLTFVILGSNADSTKLRNFTSNFLYWTDLSQPKPDSWDLLSYHAYGCASAPTLPPTTSPTIFPRTADIVFILDDSNCEASTDISSQTNTILRLLSGYTFGSDGVRIANPRSVGSAGFSYVFYTDLNFFVSGYLINCFYIRDSSFTIDKALRSSMSFAYKYTRTSEVLIFVVFTLNNGTSLQFGDDGSAMNASLAYRNQCMNPGNVEIVQINPGNGNVNPELGNYFFKYDDPNLYDKFLNVILTAEIYNQNAIPGSECIDPIHSGRL